MQETVVILDFGGQYKQLIARRVRECNVYCEILPHTTSIEAIRAMQPKGVILTGGPNSVYAADAPSCDPELFALGVPVLGICYGAQLMAYLLGGSVRTARVSEYGKADLMIDLSSSELFWNVPRETSCWMSHTDWIERVPEGFTVTAHTASCPIAAMEHAERGLYAVQFHPEVVHTPEGAQMLRAFVRDICQTSGCWQMPSFVKTQVDSLRRKIGTGRVLLGLSGGVDSSVTAALLSRAIGKQLTCVFVDHGLMRKDEAAEIERVFGEGGRFDLQFVKVDAKERFYSALEGVTDPERKRKIIGEQFIRVFETEAKKIGTVDFLAQGTIYPDVVESGTGGDVIKSHHNVGGLPETVSFREIVEPLRLLFKDEVRKAGLELGLPAALVNRQPFPGPGLAVRIVGEVTRDKVRIVQEADAIFREELERAGVDMGSGQFFAALTNMQSVGVMGDARTYAYAVVLRAVLTSDYMTARAARLSYDVLDLCMNRIINEVRGVNRVLYDLTSKPPSTIELE
ncbi:MAG: glutamine-hydrolyzing GMP synthase [Clostridia bacterium]|nr:glutamine-hydrolyzing GMP synthase [Clostridia bacterium]